MPHVQRQTQSLSSPSHASENVDHNLHIYFNYFPKESLSSIFPTRIRHTCFCTTPQSKRIKLTLSGYLLGVNTFPTKSAMSLISKRTHAQCGSKELKIVPLSMVKTFGTMAPLHRQPTTSFTGKLATSSPPTRQPRAIEATK